MNRINRFVWIALIYVMSCIFGLLISSLFETELWLEIFIIDMASTLFIYVCSLMIDNASLYDPYWSVYPPVLLFYAMLKTGHFNYLNLIIFVLIMGWSIRLTYNWAIHFKTFKHQDWRYDLLKEKAKKWYPLINLIGIQLMPTLIVYAQILVGIKLMMLNANINMLHIIPTILIIAAVTIQYIADKDMRLFRLDQTKKGIMNEGIWSISRHPNYFGEILVWFSLYLFYAFTVLKLDLFILSPIAMLALFLFISIPMMENKMLAKYPQYKTYQKQTSKLLPWFSKEQRLNEE